VMAATALVADICLRAEAGVLAKKGQVRDTVDKRDSMIWLEFVEDESVMIEKI
jgi:hypothetical protein